MLVLVGKYVHPFRLVKVRLNGRNRPCPLLTTTPTRAQGDMYALTRHAVHHSKYGLVSDIDIGMGLSK